MDNKLSELSKPVGFVSDRASTQLKEGDPASIRPFFDVQGSSPLYSQEYVSALDKVAQFWIGESAEWKQRAEDAEKRIAELETLLERNKMRVEKLGELLATPVRLPDCDIDSVSIMAHWYTDNQVLAWVAGVAHAKNQIRAAGFKVEGG